MSTVTETFNDFIFVLPSTIDRSINNQTFSIQFKSVRL
jgi:hypothetical protein